jgi:hypothetical protein
LHTPPAHLVDRQSNPVLHGEPTEPSRQKPATQIPDAQSRPVLHGMPAPEALDVEADDVLAVLDAIAPPPEDAVIPDEPVAPLVEPPWPPAPFAMPPAPCAAPELAERNPPS